MASRGGGGRRSDVNPSSSSSSFQPSGGRGGGGYGGRGGGRRDLGRGRGGGGGGGRCGGGSRPETAPPAGYGAASQPASVPQNRQVPAPTPAPADAPAAAAVTQLSSDWKRLALTSPAPALPPVSSKGVKFAQRPGFGSVGAKCVVRANHFLVQVADKDLHHYDLTITPEVPKSLNRAIISQLVNLYSESHLNKKMPAYDGMKTLFTAGPLLFESKEFVVELAEKDGSKSSKRPKRVFKVVIKFAAKASIYHLEQFLQRRQLEAPHETIQALDVVLRQIPSNEFTVVGRSFFSTSLGQPSVPNDGFEYWKGYYQSIRPTQMGLTLNIDVSARAFYEPIRVTDFMLKYCVRDISRPLTDQDRIKVKKALKGIKVAITYREPARCYKISGISNQNTSQLTFPSDDSGTQMSVVEYYKQRYSFTINYPWLPCLQVGNDTRRVYLPMEACKIVKGQRFSKKLNEKQVTHLLKATCQRPADRERSIKLMAGQSHFKGNLVKEEFGMTISTELTSVDARVLPPPMLRYNGSNCNPQVGQWNLMDKGSVENWTCVNFARLRQDVVEEFCYQLVEMCCKRGMIEKTLVELHNQMKSLGKQLHLLFIILPDNPGSYGTIKRKCETELDIISQCCQPRQVLKCSGQYLENVAMKINAKMGGRNTVLVDALSRRLPIVSQAPTIIFGADVTHPQPGEDSSPSIAAVVASMDWPEISKYRGLVSSQSHREEIIQDLYSVVQDPVKGIKHAGLIRDHLIAFRASTKHKPSRIIFFRDGVSEGQFSQVLLHEMDAIRKACASLEEGYLPPVTFIMAQKRHHTRFFPSKHGDRNMTDKSGNVLPGTVVDNKICHPTEFDFYLNSHAGIQGTSRPTHYHVLYDENHFTADQMQILTNSLCYTYARCTKSVSIVPPAYYAHLLAFRARYYIEGNEWSDSGSGAGKSTVGAQREIEVVPAVLGNVKSGMFFC